MSSRPSAEDLVRAARRAAEHSYSPYSGFAVGAAALFEDGRLCLGANVENASFGLAICAERVAVFQGVAAGSRRLVALAVHADAADPALPCGACRQVIMEFGGDAAALPVLVSGASGWKELRLAQLLPLPFRLPEKEGGSGPQ